MKLRYDPLPIFESSKTPAGLYARQKWLGQENTRLWRKDFQQTVDELFTEQSGDGSWYQSEIETIRRLFGLHLTVRNPDERINSALSWLINRLPGFPLQYAPDIEEKFGKDKLRQLPFVPAPHDHLTAAATLFLASLFGRENDAAILRAFGWLCETGLQNKGYWFDQACSCNFLRSLIVHPLYRSDIATRLAVETLAETQRQTGDWGDEAQFYLIVNALAHLDFSPVDVQLEKAFEKLFQTQQRDGSWSNTQPEWNSFLVVHAFKNKGIL